MNVTRRNLFLLFLVNTVTLVAGCGGRHAPDPPRYTAAGVDVERIVPEVEAYRILVNDELALTVLGHPDLSGPLRVLPDGRTTVPGAGSVYLLGATVEEATKKVTESLAHIVRYPQATIGVTNYGARRIFVMGEVQIPGDHEYHRGMSVLGAIAEAGGFNDRAKRSSIIVLRRMGPEEAVAFRVDLTDPLKGEKLQQDLPIRPFDIVYVPKTFIASINVLMDQYFRQLTPPFSLYIEGWQSLHLDEGVSFITR